MFTYIIPEHDDFDPQTSQFLHVQGREIVLEYSLNAIRLWESKWHVPFLTKEEKTSEQIVDLVNCMSLTGERDISEEHLRYLSTDKKFSEELENYISDPHTATTITNRENKPNREVMTAELIYYYCSELRLPESYTTHWHLQQLMTLIEVCAIKREPPKKMSKRETMASNAALNRARRAKMGSKG